MRENLHNMAASGASFGLWLTAHVIPDNVDMLLSRTALTLSIAVGAGTLIRWYRNRDK